jgi:hypothetical protein
MADIFIHQSFESYIYPDIIYIGAFSPHSSSPLTFSRLSPDFSLHESVPDRRSPVAGLPCGNSRRFFRLLVMTLLSGRMVNSFGPDCAWPTRESDGDRTDPQTGLSGMGCMSSSRNVLRASPVAELGITQ